MHAFVEAKGRIFSLLHRPLTARGMSKRSIFLTVYCWLYISYLSMSHPSHSDRSISQLITHYSRRNLSLTCHVEPTFFRRRRRRRRRREPGLETERCVGNGGTSRFSSHSRAQFSINRSIAQSESVSMRIHPTARTADGEHCTRLRLIP